MSPQETLLSQLVAFRTTAGNLHDIQAIHEFISHQLAGLPLHKQTLHDGEDIITVLTTRATKRPRLLFICHVDVVAASDDMFSMKWDTRRLYGRGVWDMKYAIAGIMAVMQSLGSDISRYDFGLALTSDEETKNHNVHYLLEKEFRPECAVILDGGEEWQLESGAKGGWGVELTVRGKSAHGSRPWEGDSATCRLLDLLSEIRSYFTEQNHASPTLNISQLSGGSTLNQIPATAAASLDIRYVTEQQGDAIKKFITRAAHAYNAHAKTLVDIPPLTHNLQDEHLQAFSKISAKVTGQHSHPVISQGASDAAACLERGIPCVVTRPLGGNHHAEGEWLDRKSFARFSDIVSGFITETTAQNK